MSSLGSPAKRPRDGQSGRTLLSNTAWNVAGQTLPLVVGIAVLPLLVRTMGLERYGFLTLVWVLVGYASVFDFGIGRALIRVVSVRIGRGEFAGAQRIASAGMSYLVAFGVAMAAAFALGSGWLVTNVMHLPAELHTEAVQSMWLLALSLPLVMVTTGYVGILSAHEQFAGLNILRAATGIANYLGPLLVAAYANRLDAVVAFVLATRAVSTLAHAWLAHKSCGFSFAPVMPDRASSRELLLLGGWMSVSNVVGPLLSYMDRLLLGALVPIRLVAFYATPYDLASKSLILPHSLMAALFPTAASVEPRSEASLRLLTKSLRLLFVLMLPLVFSLIVMARPGLNVWLGAEFADKSALVLQLLAAGLLLNALAQAPATMIQAAGKPKSMAILHIVELPLFIGLLYFLTAQFGLIGTAVAAILRNGADALAVLVLAQRDVCRGTIPWGRATVPVAMGTGLLALALWPSTGMEALIVLALGLLAFTTFAWKRLLHPDERSTVMHLLGRLS